MLIFVALLFVVSLCQFGFLLFLVWCHYFASQPLAPPQPPSPSPWPLFCKGFALTFALWGMLVFLLLP